MDTQVLKVVLTPVLVGTASLAGRYWGPAVSGWLVGLPFTSAPVVFFLALDHGVEFAAAVAVGTLAGTASQAAFCVAYGWLALRRGWPVALTAGIFTFFASTAVLQRLSLGFALLVAMVVASLAIALRTMPEGGAVAPSKGSVLPRWDLPARMVVATVFVLLLTSLARNLGPQLTGLLAPFPLYAAILTVFAHRLEGPGAAVQVLRGLLLGLFAFAGFFLVLALAIERTGIAVGFAAALAVTLALQAGSLWVLQRTSR
jgi:hypothetical protein